MTDERPLDPPRAWSPGSQALAYALIWGAAPAPLYVLAIVWLALKLS